MNILITGGCGFIGSALIRRILAQTDHCVVNLDSLTYAANPANLAQVADSSRYHFLKQDIRETDALIEAFDTHSPDAVIHLAAESHVDRSIEGPLVFSDTNVTGTASLLHAARLYWTALDDTMRDAFRFVHVSTDEVFGSLGPSGTFDEHSPYQPNSPYAASKAGADMMVRAWHETYGFPAVISNCSNNYGPYQFPEKLIPVVILSALAGQPIPIYGDGLNVRDWLLVDDHADALLRILDRGTPGQIYPVGGGTECSNIEIVRQICALLDQKSPGPQPYAEQITFVTDRPGHDRRYAINPARMAQELDWTAAHAFTDGLETTVDWYLANRAWCRASLERVSANASLERLGLV